jgi:hypothetical protein
LAEPALEGKRRSSVVLGRAEDGDHIGVADPTGLVPVSRLPHRHSRPGEDPEQHEEEHDEGGDHPVPADPPHAPNVTKEVPLPVSRWRRRPPQYQLPSVLRDHEVDDPVGADGQMPMLQLV